MQKINNEYIYMKEFVPLIARYAFFPTVINFIKIARYLLNYFLIELIVNFVPSRGHDLKSAVL